LREANKLLIDDKQLSSLDCHGARAEVKIVREDIMSKDQAKEAVARTAEQQAAQMEVKWDDTNMKSSYANVCNVMSTREEVVLMFGVNQAWHAGQKEVTVQLTDRIILSPHAAKRLSTLLANIVKQHEGRFGQLNVDVPRAGN
jgi:hypothetical protein